MPSLDEAVKDMNDAATAWAEAAKKLKEAHEWRDTTIEKSNKLHKGWVEDPSPANMEAVAHNQEIEGAAERELNEAFEAYQAAATAYMRALAGFQAALALATR